MSLKQFQEDIGKLHPQARRRFDRIFILLLFLPLLCLLLLIAAIALELPSHMRTNFGYVVVVATIVSRGGFLLLKRHVTKITAE